MKIKCTRRIQFCAGHRVMGHENKCANVHGHNYVAFIHAEAEQLDSIGRVIDFSVLKEKVGGWIDENWDHTFIAFGKDEDLIEAIQPFNKKEVFRMYENPTAENMAKLLLNYSEELLEGTGVRVTRVDIWETENCYATARI